MALARIVLGLLLMGGAAIGQQRGVLSHIAAGGGWATVITLVNRSSQKSSITVDLHFYQDDGKPLILPVTTTQQGNSQTNTTGSLMVAVDWNATLLISTGAQVASTVVGWADVRSTGELGGFAIFRYTPASGSASEGTVPLQTQFQTTLTLSYDNTAGFVMGVALVNPSPSPTPLTATIWDDNGHQLGTQNLTIAQNGHTSFVLPNVIPLTAGKRGIVQFVGGGRFGEIQGLGLRFSSSGTFTSVPTMFP